jgi:hypothetical protein
MGSFFLHGGIASATALLVSIPIIIHLINRRRFRRIDWAAMEFLLEALKKNRRRIRLEELILLAVRIVLIGLIGLFLARPILSERGIEWLGSAFRSEDKVFLLDDSFSMSRREADRSAFQRAAEAAGAQVRRLAERGSRDRITLVRASRAGDPILRGAFVDRERALAIDDSLKRLSPTDGRLQLAAALQAIADGAAGEAGEGAPRPRSILIVNDLRAADWTDGRGGPDEALRGALARLAGSEENPARIAVLDVGSDDRANIAITGSAVDGATPIAGIPADVRVTVRNFGASAARGLSLRLRFAPAPQSAGDAAGASGATVLGPSIDDLAPGASVEHAIPCTFRKPGHYGVTVELTGARDPLPGDDSFLLAVEVVSGTEVLLVNGEPSSDPLEGETDFLEQALAPGGEVPSGIVPSIVVEDGFPRQGIERFVAVFLANVHSVPDEVARLLSAYVRDGGSLVIFLGDQVDGALLNRQLGSPAAVPGGGTGTPPGDAAGLLPARIVALQDAASDPLRLSPSFDHAYFRRFRDAADILSMARFERFFVLEPVQAAQVVARFSDAAGSPALVEHAHGKGRVLLFATSADIEWNDWPRNPLYLMVLQEIVSSLARSRSRSAEHLAGAPVAVPVDIATHALEARLRGPGYPSDPERILAASTAESDSAFRFRLEDTHRAGLYALGLRTKAGEEEWLQLAVRRDAAESDLTPVTAARIRELYPEAGIEVMRDAASLADVGRGRFEASDILLWLFVGLLFVEAFLARWFAHHRRTAGEGASP